MSQRLLFEWLEAPPTALPPLVLKGAYRTRYLSVLAKSGKSLEDVKAALQAKYQGKEEIVQEVPEEKPRTKALTEEQVLAKLEILRAEKRKIFIKIATYNEKQRAREAKKAAARQRILDQSKSEDFSKIKESSSGLEPSQSTPMLASSFEPLESRSPMDARPALSTYMVSILAYLFSEPVFAFIFFCSTSCFRKRSRIFFKRIHVAAALLILLLRLDHRLHG